MKHQRIGSKLVYCISWPMLVPIHYYVPTTTEFRPTLLKRWKTKGKHIEHVLKS
jgi:hypothetical protein